MKKKPQLNKKAVKLLKLKLKQISERKVAPLTLNRSNTLSCL